MLIVVNFAKKSKQAGCTFSYDGGILPAGAYQARDLLTGAAVAPLAVEAGGFQSYAPVPTLPHQAGYVLLLEESGE